MLKEEAIRKHRAMWNWIAQQIENEKEAIHIGVLKASYIEHSGDDMEKMCAYNKCYLCEYTNVNCKECPLVWPSESKDYMCEYGYVIKTGGGYQYTSGLYEQAIIAYKINDWKLQAKICRKIANLPEKKEMLK